MTRSILTSVVNMRASTAQPDSVDRVMSSSSDDDEQTFDELYDKLTARASSGTSASARDASNNDSKLKQLLERIRAPLRRNRASNAHKGSSETEDDGNIRPETPVRAHTPLSSTSRRRVVNDASPAMNESPATLMRYLRDAQRERADMESRAEALVEHIERRDAEARSVIEETRAEMREWRERCKQLSRDVPERWLGVFESYDGEIDRLGKENFDLRERLHEALEAKLSREDGSGHGEARAETSGERDAARTSEALHLRRALRAITLERDAITVKLADVDRRERQMNLIRRHSEGTTKRLARVERLLASETARAAQAIARAERADAATASIISDYESQLTSARALIENLALRCDADDLMRAAREHDRAFPPNRRRVSVRQS